MNKKITLICILILSSVTTFGQKTSQVHPTLAIYKLLSNDHIHLKDSLIIYALNFELNIAKRDKGTIVTSISANDSLAFVLFPSHKKFSSIDFTSLMGAKNKIRLIIPILIHGSSPEKMIYKDKAGNPLISLSAAVNAAYSLYNPIKYNNNRDAEVSLGHRMFKEAKKGRKNGELWEAIFMEPIVIEIANIK